MMSCESNQKRFWATLQWATEGKQRVILSCAPYKQLRSRPLDLHIILMTQLYCFAQLSMKHADLKYEHSNNCLLVPLIVENVHIA